MSNYPGNYVAWHTGGGDPCCPDWKEPEYFEKESEKCALCLNELPLGGGVKLEDYILCDECMESTEMTEKEKLETIKKYTR